jgi:spore coat polysaccharide biosynthesis protein SpsF
MGSTRLPGKVLRPIGRTPLLGHVIGRLREKKSPWAVVVATTILDQDNVISQWCLANQVEVYRGSALDVLDRYARTAARYDFSHIVRLTADNPFTDIDELSRLISKHLDEGNDYTHSFGALPIGVGAEIFTRPALDRSDREGHASNHREHVNEYVQENPSSFKIGQLEVSLEKQAPSLRLTVDTEEDWRRADMLAKANANGWLTTQEAIRLCSRFA